LCRLPVAKSHNLGQILTFWGLLYRPPFTDEGHIWFDIAHPRHTLVCQISSRSVYSVALCWRKHQFLPFFGLRHLALSPTGSNLRKLDTSAQLQTFPYPTVSTLFLYFNALMPKSGAQSRTCKSVTDRHRDRQKLNDFDHTSGG